MIFVRSRAELQLVARVLGVGDDWHGADDVTVKVTGSSFDNAFGPFEDSMEKCITIKWSGRPVAMVNMATLFAWATGYSEPSIDADRRQEILDTIRGEKEGS